MTNKRFYDGGSADGRKTVRVLKYGREFEACLTTSLNVCGTGGKEVFVIPGRNLTSALTQSLSKKLSWFTKSIEKFTSRGLVSNVAAYKMFIKMQSGKRQLPKNILIVPWTFGPTPTLVIGHVNGQPVCATPLGFDDETSSAPLLFKKHLIGDIEELEVLEEHLNPCMQQYFVYIGDIFRSLFFYRGKRHALEVCRKVRKILATSVNAKLERINGDKDPLDKQAEVVRQRIRQKYRNELLLYEAASSVAHAINKTIEYCLGVRDDYLASVSLAKEAIARVDEETPGVIDLSECMNFLSSCPQQDALSTLDDTYKAETVWGADLRVASHFLSHILSLITDDRDKLLVFTSYHMEVYASEEFYEQFEKFAENEHSTNHQSSIKVFTGYGRQEHITLAILAKIWICDVYVLYVSNSLAAFYKSEKVLLSCNDWVIEELYYGIQTEACFHLIVAKDFRDDGERIFDKLVKQIEDYNFTSIDTLICTDKCNDVGEKLKKGIKRHFRSKIFTTHYPSRKSLNENDKHNLRNAIFIPAVKNRMANRVKALRDGLNKDHWSVVQAIYAASWDKNTGTRKSPTTTEVVNSFTWKRLDGYPVTEGWIRKVIREHLVKLIITIGGTRIPLIEDELPRINRQKTVKFTLDKIIQVILTFYGLPISPSELQKKFYDIIMERNWS